MEKGLKTRRFRVKSLDEPCRDKGAVGLEGSGEGRAALGEDSYLDTDDWRKSGSHCWVGSQGQDQGLSQNESSAKAAKQEA